MTQPIVIQQAPVQDYKPQVNFRKEEFETLILQKGYTVWHQKALECPCRSKENNQPLSTCRNCGGTGWFFLEKVQTKMVLHSMNQSTKYKDWTKENIGTVSITARDIDRLAFMDKITVLDGEGEHSQTLFPIVSGDKIFAYSVYSIKEVLYLYLFQGDNLPHRKLIEGQDFTFTENRIQFSAEFAYLIEPLQMTIRYIHRPEYHVLDISRETMVTTIVNDKGRREEVQMPISGVGRRSHYILQPQNIRANLLIDNSHTEGIQNSGNN